MTFVPQGGGAAIVTGSASGLGRALCRLLAEAGWRVGGIDREPCEELPHSAVADVADAGAVEQAVARLAGELGGLTAMASCAGVFRNTLSPTHALPAEDWATTLAVNATGSFNVARACIPHLLRGGGGSIVLTASAADRHPQPGGAAYSASKAAVAALARVIALEYAAHGIRCNAVAPGYMRTAMTARVLARDDLRERIEATIPAGRVAEPEEVAEVIRFLMAPRSAYLTGEEITVDGGSALTGLVDSADVARMWARRERRET